MQRLLAISDIHGEKNKLERILKNAKYNPLQDKLILVGDYVDRGPQPIETLKYIKELVDNGAIALIGNHDLMFLELIKNNKLDIALTSQYYKKLGSYITINQYKKLTTVEQQEIQLILQKLLSYYEYQKYIFVHAGVDAKKSLYEQKLHDIIWIRDEFYYYKAYNKKIIIFGHTPTQLITGKSSIWVDSYFNDKIGIDCGCVYGGRLACVDLTNKLVYYV